MGGIQLGPNMSVHEKYFFWTKILWINEGFELPNSGVSYVFAFFVGWVDVSGGLLKNGQVFRNLLWERALSPRNKPKIINPPSASKRNAFYCEKTHRCVFQRIDDSFKAFRCREAMINVSSYS